MKSLVIPFAFFSQLALAESVYTVAGPRATGYLGRNMDMAQIEYDDTVLDNLPAEYDARKELNLPPTRDQGSCGSCWAFASVRSLEISLVKLANKNMDLSEQDMVSCTKNAYKCSGGFMESAQFLLNGITDEKNWPYSGSNARCRKTPKIAKAIEVKLLGGPSTKPSVDMIKSAILAHGSAFVTVAAGNSGWSGATGEVSGRGCIKGQTNHMVVLVGWTADDKWIMSNSWGQAWADNGYTLMKFGCANVGEEAGYITAAVSE